MGKMTNSALALSLVLSTLSTTTAFAETTDTADVKTPTVSSTSEGTDSMSSTKLTKQSVNGTTDDSDKTTDSSNTSESTKASDDSKESTGSKDSTAKEDKPTVEEKTDSKDAKDSSDKDEKTSSKDSKSDSKSEEKSSDEKSTKKTEEKSSKTEKTEKTAEKKSSKETTTSKYAKLKNSNFHLKIYYSASDATSVYVPEFTVELGDKNDKLLGKIKASSANFNKKEGYYDLAFKTYKPYKHGDKLKVQIVKADKIFQNVKIEAEDDLEDADGMVTTWTLKNNQYAEVNISGTTTDPDTKYEKDVLYTSAEQPLEGYLTTKTNMVGIHLVTDRYNDIKHQKFMIDGKTYVTDSKGLVWVDASKVGKKKHTYEIENFVFRDEMTSSIDYQIFPELSKGFTIQTFRLIKDDGSLNLLDSSQSTGVIKTNFKTTKSTSLTDAWTTTTLKFTNKEGKTFEYDASEENPEISGLAQGTYKVTASAKYASVKLSTSTVTVKNNKTTPLTITATPKYTLEVDKDGESYDFSVVNVDKIADKKFKGNNTQTFGVIPGASYMVNDNEDAQVYTVPIQNDSPVTKLVLGQGVVFGGDVTTPHTGDTIIFLIGFLLIALILGGISFYYLDKQKKDRLMKSGLIGVILLGTLGGSYAPFSDASPTLFKLSKFLTGITGTEEMTASASSPNVSRGVKGGNSGGSSPAKGAISTETDISMIQVGFIDAFDSEGKNYLNDYSTITQLRQKYKFSDSNQVYMLYMAPNNKSLNLLKDADNANVATHAGGTKVTTILGAKNPLGINATTDYVDGSKGKTDATVDARILPSRKYAKESSNAFVAFMGYVVEYLDGSDSTRQVWANAGSSAEHNYGTALSSAFRSWLKKHGSSQVTTFYDGTTGELKESALFKGYISYLEDTVKTQASKAAAAKLKLLVQTRVTNSPDPTKADSGLVLFTQVMTGHEKMGHSTKKVQFMPLHESAQWYLAGVKKVYPNTYKSVNPMYEERIIEAGKSRPGTSANKKIAKITASYSYSNVRKTFKKALKPQTKKVKTIIKNGQLNIAKNPFNGWGYITMDDAGRESVETRPRLFVKAYYKLYKEEDDGTMEYKEQVSSSKAKYSPTSTEQSYFDSPSISKELMKYVNKDTIKGHTELFYKRNDGTTRTIRLTDKLDTKMTLRVYPFDVISPKTKKKKEFKHGALGITYTKKDKIKTSISVPDLYDKSDDKWELYQRATLPDLNILGYYLGASTDDEDKFKDVVRLFPQRFNDVKIKHANAQLILTFPAFYYDEKTSGEPVPVNLVVPQYKFGKYNNSILPDDFMPGAKGKFTLNLQRRPDAITESLEPSGDINFKLFDPDTSPYSWLTSRPKTWDYGVGVTKSPVYSKSDNISLDDLVGEIKVVGDALTTKVNPDSGAPDPVMNTKLAQWKNAFTLYNGTTLATNKATHVKTSGVTKQTGNIEYKIKSTVEKFTYTYTYWSTCYGVDSEGNPYSYSCVKEGSEVVGGSYDQAKYKISVLFKHYDPKEGLKSKIFKEEKDAEAREGYRTQATQNDIEIRIVPEVAMIYDDLQGNSSAAYAAGDLERDIKPVTYYTARYKTKTDDPTKSVEIEPTVEGSAVATDGKAKALAQNLLKNSDAKKNDASVIYRGSAVSTNFDVDGVLEFKTYALDIGNTALKSTWGNENYKTDKLNKDYLDKFLDQQGDSKWVASIKSTGSLYSNDEELTKVRKVLKVVQKSNSVKEHVLQVRGGKVISVDGDEDYDKWNKSDSLQKRELYEALDNMHLLDGDEGVLSSLEDDGGDKSTGIYASLTNLLRQVNGTSEKMKGGDAWYNEDTSQLIVREYTTTFDLPDYMYTDKVPLSVAGLESEIDKNKFFQRGYLGYTQLKYDVGKDSDDMVSMLFNSSDKEPFGGVKTVDYIIPDVSVTDSTR